MIRAEAINWLINIMSDIGKAEHRDLWHYEQALAEIKKMLEEEPHWIPCSVKHPDPDERVLVTSGGYDCYVWDCMPNRGDDYFWEDEEGFYHNKYEVRAWMPLPEPWRGDEE